MPLPFGAADPGTRGGSLRAKWCRGGLVSDRLDAAQTGVGAEDETATRRQCGDEALRPSHVSLPPQRAGAVLGDSRPMACRFDTHRRHRGEPVALAATQALPNPAEGQPMVEVRRSARRAEQAHPSTCQRSRMPFPPRLRGCGQVSAVAPFEWGDVNSSWGASKEGT